MLYIQEDTRYYYYSVAKDFCLKDLPFFLLLFIHCVNICMTKWWWGMYGYGISLVMTMMMVIFSYIICGEVGWKTVEWQKRILFSSETKPTRIDNLCTFHNIFLSFVELCTWSDKWHLNNNWFIFIMKMLYVGWFLYMINYMKHVRLIVYHFLEYYFRGVDTPKLW